MIEVLTTERLSLRPRIVEDLAENLAMDLDPRVHRYIFSEAPDPEAHRREIFARIASRWPPYGAIWALERRDVSGFIGWCGAYSDVSPEVLELAYRLAPGAWGRGFATEAARAVLEHVFSVLNCRRVTAFHHPDNSPSQRVLEKLGFTRSGVKEYGGIMQPAYTAERSAWGS